MSDTPTPRNSASSRRRPIGPLLIALWGAGVLAIIALTVVMKLGGTAAIRENRPQFKLPESEPAGSPEHSGSRDQPVPHEPILD